MKRLVFVLITCASLGLAGCSDGVLSGSAQAASANETPRGVPDYLTVARVERGMIQDIVPAVGRIQAADQVEIGAEVSGRIIEVAATYDDRVSAGDILARIDPAPFETAVDRAEAQLNTALASRAEAEARLEASTVDLDRSRGLHERGTVPFTRVQDLELEVRELTASVERAEGLVDLARSQLEQARIDLDRTVITAPMDGFVLDRRIEVGQSVNAALSTPVLFVIAANLENVVIEAEVAEADVARITEGMQVRFSVDAYPGYPFEGQAGAVRRSPTIRNRFVTYTVPIQARDRDERLLPGMTASVEFIAAEAINEILVPREARSIGVPRGFVIPEDIETWVRDRHAVPETEPLMPYYEGSVFGAMLGDAARNRMQIIFVWEDGGTHVRHVRIGAESDTHFAVPLGDIEVGDWVVVDSRDPVFEDL